MTDVLRFVRAWLRWLYWSGREPEKFHTPLSDADATAAVRTCGRQGAVVYGTDGKPAMRIVGAMRPRFR